MLQETLSKKCSLLGPEVGGFSERRQGETSNHLTLSKAIQEKKKKKLSVWKEMNTELFKTGSAQGRNKK